jgi:hypothetical protein
MSVLLQRWAHSAPKSIADNQFYAAVRWIAPKLRENANTPGMISHEINDLIRKPWPNRSRPHALDERQPVRKLMLQCSDHMQEDQDRQRLGEDFMRAMAKASQPFIFP